MTNQLVALANGREMGSVIYRNARLSFVYEDSWKQDQGSYPLSLSMPLAAGEHGHSKIEAFLWGLLPDNDRVLESWARRFQVSPRNAFRLIANVGEDCAGAVQFVRPGRLESLRTEPTAREIAWLTEDDIAERLRALRADHSAWRAAADAGQFSLAGAQPKTALLLERDRWGIPSGRTPTTHILKPPAGEWDGHAENGHFCLRLARASGLVVPNSSVRRFRDEIAIVIERYDRIQSRGERLRVHQIRRICAKRLPCIRRGNTRMTAGREFARSVDLLREHSTHPGDDVQSFLDAIAFNWLIAGTDAHAKNYALLLGAHGGVRLAPFYDVASVLPYRGINLNKAKLAMKIGANTVSGISAFGIGFDWRRMCGRTASR